MREEDQVVFEEYKVLGKTAKGAAAAGFFFFFLCFSFKKTNFFVFDVFVLLIGFFID